jgi:hypothetical protein
MQDSQLENTHQHLSVFSLTPWQLSPYTTTAASTGNQGT